MAKRKKQRVREKGKIRLSQYFQNLEKGQKVAIKPEASIPFHAPMRLRGKVGIVEGKRGKSYIVKVKAGNKMKTLILKPIHLIKVS
ncbi:MAG: 50S ribosomal protein L21e [Nanoarchaeota archaeon]|nr:50S ribosomal protein L21e [Nanoarchaeota archaeon]